MFFRISRFGLLFLVFLIHYASALAFDPVAGPFAKGAQVPLSWTLDGTEPAAGWELWFNGGGSSNHLTNIPPQVVSTVVPFPGVDGTFEGLSGVTTLATSNVVDVAVPPPPSFSATATFSASVASGFSRTTGIVTLTFSSLPSLSTSSSSSSASVSSGVSKKSSTNTGTILGIIAGTLAVIAIIVVASTMLLIQRRRNRRAMKVDTYPFADKDMENQITPFDARPSRSFLPARTSPPSRNTSLPLSRPPVVARRNSPLPPLPPSASPSPVSSPSPARSDARRQAYLDAQLQRLAIAQQAQAQAELDGKSILFSPLSRVPSERTVQHFDLAVRQTAPPLPSLPEPGMAGSRGDAYLTEQLHRLEMARRPSNVSSVVFSPLSTVPSEYTPAAAAAAAGRSVSASTAVNSPIRFRRPSGHSEGDVLSPVTPAYVPPW
ncbi:hypothetical protein GGX14DRAFT_479669 [Mycena pura]|uniref:Uncharacterized protein n=1 Tax=Mycena pura TaxID=153505 RepID=A0AAD6UQL6_9AGAR|nr:hypothetical protein GGX14DRAFT_479669 [Mycena pura]